MEVHTNPFERIDYRFDKLEELYINLSNKLSNIKQDSNQFERLTRKQVSEQYKICYGTIHNGMKQNKLSYEKLGRKTLFQRQEIEKWIRTTRKDTI